MNLLRTLGLLLPFVVGACRSAALPIEPERSPAAPPASAAVTIPAPPPPAHLEPAPKPGPSFAVAATGSMLFPFRPVGGPVLLSDPSHRALYETKPDGSLRPLPALGTLFAERYPPHLILASVTGVWPIVTAELASGGRTMSFSRPFLIDTEKGTVKVLHEQEAVSALMPWTDGRQLGVRFRKSAPRAIGELELFVAGGGRGAVPPKLPRGATFEGELVAYPTGDAFATGEPGEAPAYQRASGNVFVATAGGAFVAHAMPERVSGLVRGRTATDTFARGDRMLRRWNGQGWVDVALPDAGHVNAVAVGDDGVVWMVLGEALYRGTLPELAWTREALPADFEVRTVAATSANDVWLFGNDDRTLHRGGVPAGAPMTLPDDADGYVRLVGSEPHPLTDDCALPLLLLGDPASTPEATARALHLEPLPGRLVRGRVGSGDVYAFEVTPIGQATGDVATLKRLLPKVRARVPTARVACGRVLDPKPID